MKILSTVVSLAVASSLLLQCNAKVYGEALSNGPGGLWLKDLLPFIDANNNPDGTNIVHFYLRPENPVPEELWTWRVNVSAVSVPDATNQDGTPIGPDPRILNTVFDLRWPNSTAELNQTADAMQQTSSSPKQPLCASILASPFWPDVTNRYRNSDNGNCSNAIGAECANALIATSPPGYASDDCPPFSYLDQIKECQYVLGNISPITSLGVTLSASNLNASVNGSSPLDEYPLHNGYAFFSHSDIASPGPNRTALYQAESQLQMMLLRGQNINRLLCMRVNTTIDGNTVNMHAGEKRPKGSTALSVAAKNAGAVATAVGVAAFSVFFGFL